MAAEQKRLRLQIHDIMWHMRGSLSREEAWTLSEIERKELLEYIESRMKIVEKTKLALL